MVKGRSLTAGSLAVVILLDVFHGRSTAAVTVLPPPLRTGAASPIRASAAASPPVSIVPPVNVPVPVPVSVIPCVPLGTTTRAARPVTFAGRTVRRGASVVTPN